MHTNVPMLTRAFGDALAASEWARLAIDHVAVLLVEVAPWTCWLPAAGALLDRQQAARVQRQRIGWRREELQLCYALQRLALGHVLGLDPAALGLSRSDQGQPLLAMGNWQTSLSHTDGYMALAVTAAGPVGIDIERAARADELPEIAGLVCHPTEFGSIASQPSSGLRLLELWVRKEALLKAAGVGLARAMTGFPAPLGQVLPLSVRPGDSTQLQMLDAGSACVAALAAPPGSRVDCRWLRGPGPMWLQATNTAPCRQPASVES
jgi:4'-phosphopantetheinyl transferase